MGVMVRARAARGSRPSFDAERLDQAARTALDAARGFDLELIVTARAEALARFGNNAVTQHVDTCDVDLVVRVQKQGLQGRASANQLDSDSIRRAVAAAIDTARVQRPQPDLLPLPGPQPYRALAPYVARTVEMPAGAKVDAIKQTTAACRRRGLTAAGIFSTGWQAVGIANSNGLRAFNRQTTASFSLTVLARDSSGWAEATHRDVGRIDTERLTAVAIDKARSGARPRELAPGAYDLVLEPAAVADLLLFTAWDGFGGLQALEGRSFVSGRLGESVFAPSVRITDDAYHPDTIGLNFDFEGLPRQAVRLIDAGRAAGVVHDRKTARAAGVESTGHALPQPNTTGPMPLNLVMEPGDATLEQMIANTERGLLVTHFHYTNILEPRTLLITGMTRDGLFLIERGKVRRPAKNLRFTESVVGALNRVAAIGRATEYSATFWGGGGIVCPALAIKQFNFSSATRF